MNSYLSNEEIREIDQRIKNKEYSEVIEDKSNGIISNFYTDFNGDLFYWTMESKDYIKHSYRGYMGTPYECITEILESK